MMARENIESVNLQERERDIFHDEDSVAGANEKNKATKKIKC